MVQSTQTSRDTDLGKKTTKCTRTQPVPRIENFIPVRKADLLDLVCREPDLAAEEQHDLRRVCHLLGAMFHFEYHGQLEQLKQAYAPFDPDADTRQLFPPSPDELEGRLDVLFERFKWLLARGNFHPLSRSHIESALTAMSDWGVNLKVNFDVFDRLEVFARGDTMGRRSRRRWRNYLRLEEVDLPIYQRLVVIFRLHKHPLLGRHADTKTVYIKVFKDIPHMDLEMLLPGTTVEMSLTDRAKIFVPTLSGLAVSGFKIFKGALVLAAAGVWGLLAFLGLVGGTLGYGVRSYFGYLNTRQKYQLNLTESLYYQNLDNNAGVLFRLLDEAEEQECREAILAYFFLWHHVGDEGWTEEQLDRHIEAFLKEKAQCTVDFEIGDALEKLRRLGLVVSCSGDRLRAIPPDAALQTSDRTWDNLFCFHQPAC